MSPPEKFTNGELPELDEAGYASLILRTVKSDSKVAEPVYERIKGERSMSREYVFIIIAVTSSGILKAKQKLGIAFNSDKLGGIDFTKFSKLTMCSA